MTLKASSCDEVLAAKRDLKWVIYPLIARGSSMMLFARQGAGKSSLAVQLAHSLISGDPWIGFEVKERGPVLYLQLDMSREEMYGLLSRAHDAGLAIGEHLHVTQPEEDEETVFLDILQEGDMKELTELCASLQPIAVIVDTIHDSYEALDKYKDVNALARRVHRRLKEAIGSAALVFLNHERKQVAGAHKGKKKPAAASASASTSDDDLSDEDEDAFMGGQAWEGKVAASLALRRIGRGKATLSLRKVRLAQRPFMRMLLEIDEHGFFHPKRDYKQLLLEWPDCLPSEERAREIALLKNKADVFKRIAEITGEQYHTVRVHESRHRDVEYAWKKYLEKAGDEEPATRV